MAVPNNTAFSICHFLLLLLAIPVLFMVDVVTVLFDLTRVAGLAEIGIGRPPPLEHVPDRSLPGFIFQERFQYFV